MSLQTVHRDVNAWMAESSHNSIVFVEYFLHISVVKFNSVNTWHEVLCFEN